MAANSGSVLLAALKSVLVHDRRSLSPHQSYCKALTQHPTCPAVTTGGSQGEQLRVQLGRAIRQLKAHWRLAAVLVPLLQLPAAAPLGVESAAAEAAADSPPAASGSSKQGADADLLQQQTAAVQLLLSAAKGFGLEDCWQWKPLLDGKQVRAVWVISLAGAMGGEFP